MKMEAETGGTQPPAWGRLELPGAGRGRKDPPWSLQREPSPGRPGSQMPGVQDEEMTNFAWLSPPVMAIPLWQNQGK